MHVQPALFGAPQTQFTSDDYYTPAWLFERMGLTFDLDVCAPPGGVPWIPAARYFTMEDDGLAQEWNGCVWMNPPFGTAARWLERFMDHRHGVCLVPFSKSKWFERLWTEADGLVSPDGAGTFQFANGGIQFPIVMAAFGIECVAAISRLGAVRVTC